MALPDATFEMAVSAVHYVGGTIVGVELSDAPSLRTDGYGHAPETARLSLTVHLPKDSVRPYHRYRVTLTPIEDDE
jgi:hypothetical protein